MFHSGRKATPKSRDDQGPTNQRVGMAPSSRRLHVSRKSPGAGYQGRTATRASQVSRVTARAPALRLPSHQSILLSFYHMPCVANVLIPSCVAVHKSVSSFCHSFSILYLRSLLFCGAPSGELKARQEGTAICRLFGTTRSAARAAGQRAPAAHQEQVCLRSPPSVVRLLSQGQYE